MPEQILIEQAHGLPRAAAEALAQRWRLDGEQRFALQCETLADRVSGEHCLRFSRRGLSGQLRVSDTHFMLDVELGFFLSAFRTRIEAALQDNLQQALREAAADDAAPPDRARRDGPPRA